MKQKWMFDFKTKQFFKKLMAELFQASVLNVNMHLKSIFGEGELEENRTIKDFLNSSKRNSKGQRYTIIR